MTTLAFAKGHGTGNDFVLIADPEGDFELTSERVRQLCDRQFGIGADGVIRAVRSRAIKEGARALAEEPAAEWFMDHWNADGTAGEMCGNGIRVYVHFLIEEGLAAPGRGTTIAIGTRSGVRDVLVGDGEFTVDLGPWTLKAERLVAAAGLDVSRPAQGIEVSGLHLVSALAHEGELEALKLAEAPELSPDPPLGANVEFVVPMDPFLEDGVARIRMRVHERGAGETLSCGTGAAAAALAFRHWGGAEMPHEWMVDVPGGSLGVRMLQTAEGEHVSVSGPAALVFRGTIEV